MTKKEILSHTAHRPWPLPSGPWVMQQTWQDLLFAHWPVPPEELRPLIPEGLNLDIFEGKAWVGITPFKMRDVRFRLLPPIPTATNFYEVNVRTYVHLNGRHGIYFFSLDASSTLSVMGARFGAFLPYFRANISVEENNDGFDYKSKRTGSKKVPADLHVKYKPVSPAFESKKGSLEEWLIERYCLFQPLSKNKIIEIDIHHLKWPLHKAEAQIIENTIALPEDIKLTGEPLVHYARKLEMMAWPMKVVSPQ